MSTTTLAEQITLDLGHTYLEGQLVFDSETQRLVLVSPTGTERVLGTATYDDQGTPLSAEAGCVFVEAFGLDAKLPAALLGTELVEEVSVTTAGVWAAPLHQMRVTALAPADITAEE